MMTNTIPGQETAFEQDVCAYLDVLPTLLSTSEGKFALVGGATLTSVFDNRTEAMRVGYARFGDRGFLVQEVTRHDLEMGMHWQQSC
jgi:hypothetical protein